MDASSSDLPMTLLIGAGCATLLLGSGLAFAMMKSNKGKEGKEEAADEEEVVEALDMTVSEDTVDQLIISWNAPILINFCFDRNFLGVTSRSITDHKPALLNHLQKTLSVKVRTMASKSALST